MASSAQRQCVASACAQGAPSPSTPSTVTVEGTDIVSVTSPGSCGPRELTRKGISYVTPTPRSTEAAPAVSSMSRSACTQARALPVLLLWSPSPLAVTLAAADSRPASVAVVFTVRRSVDPDGISPMLHTTENGPVVQLAPGRLAPSTGLLRFNASTALRTDSARRLRTST